MSSARAQTKKVVGNTTKKIGIAIGKLGGDVTGTIIETKGRTMEAAADVARGMRQVKAGARLIDTGYEKEGLKKITNGSKKVGKSSCRLFCCLGCPEDSEEVNESSRLIF